MASFGQIIGNSPVRMLSQQTGNGLPLPPWLHYGGKGSFPFRARWVTRKSMTPKVKEHFLLRADAIDTVVNRFFFKNDPHTIYHRGDSPFNSRWVSRRGLTKDHRFGDKNDHYRSVLADWFFGAATRVATCCCGPSEACCLETTLPTTLHATITSLSGCACLAGATFTLAHHFLPYHAWTGVATTNCSVGKPKTCLQISCLLDSFGNPLCWTMQLCCVSQDDSSNGCLIGNTWIFNPDGFCAGCNQVSCNPLSFEFNCQIHLAQNDCFIYPDECCCEGQVKVTVTL